MKYITSGLWMNFVNHIIKEENKLCRVDFLLDEILNAKPETGGHIILTISGHTTSDSNSVNEENDLTIYLCIYFVEVLII